jgi:hypothetical protein
VRERCFPQGVRFLTVAARMKEIHPTPDIIR